MSQIAPKRMILRCREHYIEDYTTMVTTFFDSQLLDQTDSVVNILADPICPNIYYVIFDVNCKANPEVDLSTIQIEVFKVSKPKNLLVASPDL